MNTILSALTKAAAGLLFPSETDAPFAAFSWGKQLNTAETIRVKGAVAKEDACRELSLDDFLGDLLEEQEFRTLQKAILANLADVKVYRCGSIEVTYFIVGTTTDGQIAGLKTTGVET